MRAGPEMALQSTEPQPTNTDKKHITFAIVLTWPTLKNAEYEVAYRLATAGANLGAEVYLIDDDGYPLWSSKRQLSFAEPRLSAKECDFIISLHFQSPKLFDVYSYVTLWNPPNFYKVFGYDSSTQNLASHDDLLSCSSEQADAHAMNIFSGYGRSVPTPLGNLYHSPPAPCLEPNITKDSRPFYIGINWERISGEKGRHHDLLVRLDAANLIDIYGPERFHGVAPWAGFKNYRGSLPFDGKSILTKINESGICLAFSSADHQRSGIMSNRLFEGLAAGAVIIANSHTLIDKHFKDCVYVVDDQARPLQMFNEVRRIVAEIRNDPAAAVERALLGQRRFLERFSLERSLAQLFVRHRERTQTAAVVSQEQAEIVTVDVIVVIRAHVGIESVSALIDDVMMQRGVGIHLTLIADRALLESSGARIRDSAAQARQLRLLAREDLGLADEQILRPSRSAISKILTSITAPFFCIMYGDERWFSEHLLNLTHALKERPESFFAASGRIDEGSGDDDDERARRKLHGLIFRDLGGVVGASDLQDSGRFLYRTSLLQRMPPYLLDFLDGVEERAFALWALLSGPLAQTARATYVRIIKDADLDRSPLLDEDLQVEMILDSARGNSEWQRLQSQLQIGPRRLRERFATRLESARIYSTAEGGDGVAMLASGFSRQEAEFTWIDGKIAVLKFSLPSDIEPRDYSLVLVVGGRKSQTGDEQECTIFINGERAVEAMIVSEGASRIVIPLKHFGRLRARDAIRLRLTLRHASRVFGDDGAILDPRRLGLWVGGVGIEKSSPTTPMLAATVENQKLATALQKSAVRIEPDRLYSTAAGGDGLEILAGGFSGQEDAYTWIDGKDAVLKFILPRNIEPSDYVLVLVAGGRKSRAGDEQECTVFINGERAVEALVVPESSSRIEIPLKSLADLRADDVVSVRLTLRHASRVFDDDDEIIDPRRLGLWIARVGVEKSAAAMEARILPGDAEKFTGSLAPAPPLAPSRLYSTAAGGDGLGILAAGFSYPEEDSTWMDGKTALLRFALPRDIEPSDYALILVAGGRKSLTGDEQECTISVNGEPVVEALVVPERSLRIEIPLKSLARRGAGDVISVGLTLRHANRVFDDEEEVIDSRRLGLWIEGVGIEKSESTMEALSRATDAEDAIPANGTDHGKQPELTMDGLPDQTAVPAPLQNGDATVVARRWSGRDDGELSP